MEEEIKLYTEGEYIKHLKSEDVEAYNDQYEVTKHKIFTDFATYPDRIITSKYYDENGEEQTETKTEKINRIGLPYQKRIVTIGKIFQCGIPYIYEANPTAQENDFYNAFLEVISENKMQFLDMNLAEYCKRFTMTAELWYVEEDKNTKYGFDSNYEIKCKVISPEDYGIYAKFDEKDDLTSLTIHTKTETKEAYQIYTAEEIITLTKEDGNWTRESAKNAIEKIPLVFYEQDNVEWHDVQNLIEIAERQRTYQSESNKKFGEPILKLAGEVLSSGKSDGGGRVLQLKNGGDADFIQPPNANESFKDEMRTNRRDIHEFTQTPDISDEFFEGKGNMLSGIGRKLTWLPAHLKVLENNKIYSTALQRRISIVSSFLKLANPKFETAIETLKIKPVITPFDINNKDDMIDTLMAANGNKPLMSQQTSMVRYGINDVDAEIEQINKENVKDFGESEL